MHMPPTSMTFRDHENKVKVMQFEFDLRLALVLLYANFGADKSNIFFRYLAYVPQPARIMR